jgi:hypothetical protein
MLRKTARRGPLGPELGNWSGPANLCTLRCANLKINTQIRPHCAKNGREVIHAAISAGRKHAVKAFAWLGHHFRQLLESNRSIDEIAEYEARRFRFVT